MNHPIVRRSAAQPSVCEYRRKRGGFFRANGSNPARRCASRLGFRLAARKTACTTQSTDSRRQARALPAVKVRVGDRSLFLRGQLNMISEDQSSVIAFL